MVGVLSSGSSGKGPVWRGRISWGKGLRILSSEALPTNLYSLILLLQGALPTRATVQYMIKPRPNGDRGRQRHSCSGNMYCGLW